MLGGSIRFFLRISIRSCISVGICKLGIVDVLFYKIQLVKILRCGRLIYQLKWMKFRYNQNYNNIKFNL